MTRVSALPLLITALAAGCERLPIDAPTEALAEQSITATPSCPNRPQGAVTVLETPFTTSDGEGQLWEVYPGAGQIVAAPGAPASPATASASILSPRQATGGQQTIWPKPGRQQPLSNLYMCLVWKMNPQFVGVRTFNKLVFMAAQDFTFGRQPTNGLFGVIPVDTSNYPATSAPFKMIFGHNTGSLDNSHACSTDLGLACNPNVTTTPLFPGVWYTVEAQVIASSCPTCRDGTVKWWIDGRLQGSYSNLNYGQGIVNEWQLNHTWDGSAAVRCGPPTDPSNPLGRACENEQIHFFDHLVLASVGALGAGGGGITGGAGGGASGGTCGGGASGRGSAMGTRPFAGSPQTLPGPLLLARYDEGGEGLAYHDRDPANLMTAPLRPAEGVDANQSGLGWVLAGEWVSYTVDVTTAGSYLVTMPMSHPGTGGALHLSLDGNPFSGPIALPSTSGWGDFQNVSVRLSFPAGVHVLRLEFDANGSTGYGPGLGNLTIR